MPITNNIELFGAPDNVDIGSTPWSTGFNAGQYIYANQVNAAIRSCSVFTKAFIDKLVEKGNVSGDYTLSADMGLDNMKAFTESALNGYIKAQTSMTKTVGSNIISGDTITITMQNGNQIKIQLVNAAYANQANEATNVTSKISGVAIADIFQTIKDKVYAQRAINATSATNATNSTNSTNASYLKNKYKISNPLSLSNNEQEYGNILGFQNYTGRTCLIKVSARSDDSNIDVISCIPNVVTLNPINTTNKGERIICAQRYANDSATITNTYFMKFRVDADGKVYLQYTQTINPISITITSIEIIVLS